jgi:hypothetical protein
MNRQSPPFVSGSEFISYVRAKWGDDLPGVVARIESDVRTQIAKLAGV